MTNQEFNVGVIKPIECLKEGYAMIKDQYWLFFGITFVGMLIGGIIPLGIGLGAMFCGIYYCLFLKMNRQQVKFEDLLKGFNYFVPALVATLIFIIPTIILAVFMYISMFAWIIAAIGSGGQISEAALVGMIVTIFVEIIVIWLIVGGLHTLLIFAYPLIVERNMKGWDAFKLSAKAAWQNLGGVVGFILMEFVLGLAAYIISIPILGLGVYFVMPIMFAGALVVYRKVFPLDNSANFNNPPSPSAFSGAGTYN